MNWEAYHAGCESDQQNQMTDITRAKDFVSKNPITIESVRKKTLRACLEHAPINFVDQLAYERDLFFKQRDELSQTIAQLEFQIENLKQILRKAEFQKNSDQVSSHRKQALNELETLEIENDALLKKRQLMDCILEAGDSLEEVEDCHFNPSFV